MSSCRERDLNRGQTTRSIDICGMFYVKSGFVYRGSTPNEVSSNVGFAPTQFLVRTISLPLVFPFSPIANKMMNISNYNIRILVLPKNFDSPCTYVLAKI